jgi:pimeloyl-ACP methyl ester carboxylesterase
MSLQRTGQAPAAAERDTRAMLEPGALRGGLNWYRALLLTDPREVGGKVTVPTLYVWSDDDAALLPKAAYETERYVTGDYRFEIMPGVSHWIPEEKSDELSDLLLEWFAAHPAT